METSRLRAGLDHEFHLLRAAIASADREAKVPGCPDWTADQLAHHVAQTYLHKVECIRLGEFPQDWPPQLDPDPVAVLDEQFGALTASFDAHDPAGPAATWHDPDQTVGFWIRRMAHETVVHRVDAEQVAGLELAPIDDEVALDGIDEFLTLFIGFFSRKYPEEYGSALRDPDPRPLAVTAGNRTWTLATTEAGVEVTAFEDDVAAGEHAARDAAERAAVTVSGQPADVLLWLWVRVDDGAVRITGDEQALAQFKALRKEATQ
ncbi:maleylpyruvate isomerase family mycothiol-dependent enzyme [Actinospica durhamensis]|uniref:Maleylpyruvate isomerase family mycothiol-dependent enzyme n=1 Tax=Actinospica durhamensis TaxID=1508375 RepID=A0A941EQ19_9ACTN|nr:maleylpyruvate isomerase family mycothiol-dependent enzyme [Actinospica durhamensis]MBR7833064.1 maleylpyruvate isomerase family mycothiol-dependent enzyme [Actinospica durhamensis]